MGQTTSSYACWGSKLFSSIQGIFIQKQASLCLLEPSPKFATLNPFGLGGDEYSILKYPKKGTKEMF